MEKKKDFIKALNYAKYLAFILATVCVFVFQFTAAQICLTLALALYVVAFGLMFATMVIHCVQICDADAFIKKENAVVVETAQSVEAKEGEAVEVVNLKAEKVWSVIGAVFYGLFTIFTFVVLVLF